MKVSKTPTGYLFEPLTDSEQKELERLAFEFQSENEEGGDDEQEGYTQ